MTELFPIFVNLSGRKVVLVGGGRVASAKLGQLIAAGARIDVVAPGVCQVIADAADRTEPPVRVTIFRRRFTAADLDDAWLAVAAATPEVNRDVANAAELRHVFVNAVDDPVNASAFLSGVVRRSGVTIAISTAGEAPALTALLREALDKMMPRDLAAWMRRARAERTLWKRDGVPIDARKPRLLRALNEMYARKESTL